jgi:hypothetical protein
MDFRGMLLAHRSNLKQSRQRRVSLWLITKSPDNWGKGEHT